MKLIVVFYLFAFLLNIGLAKKETLKKSFLAVKSNENFMDDFGDFNMEDQLLKEKPNENLKNEHKIDKTIKTDNLNAKSSEKTKKDNIDDLSSSKTIKNNIITTNFSLNNQEGLETNVLLNKLNTNFLSELIKLQNNPLLKNFSTMINNKNEKENKASYNSKMLSDPNMKIISKRNFLDTSKLTYFENLVNNMLNDVDKTTKQIKNYLENNKKLQKDYDHSNNQIIIYQSKLEGILNEIKYITDFKNTFANQNDFIKQTSGFITESNENLKKIINDLEEKLDKLDSFKNQIIKNIESFEGINEKLKSENIDQTKKYEEIEQKYQKVGESKEKLVKSIHESFKKFDHQELQFLDVKEREKELDLELKKQENTEKLLSLEIEHLKASNMLEIQKVEEMKQEIEKSKNIKENLLRENDELDDKLKLSDSESKEIQMEYEIRKNEYEDILSNAKKEINYLRKSKNAIIDNNNIIQLKTPKIKEDDPIQLKTPKKKEVLRKPLKSDKRSKDKVPLKANILTDGIVKQPAELSSNINFIEKDSVNKGLNVSQSDKEIDDFLKKNNINSMKDLEDKVEKFKNEKQLSSEKGEDESALKSQILSLINSIKS